jgi:hypothetical protein
LRKRSNLFFGFGRLGCSNPYLSVERVLHHDCNSYNEIYRYNTIVKEEHKQNEIKEKQFVGELKKPSKKKRSLPSWTELGRYYRDNKHKLIMILEINMRHPTGMQVGARVGRRRNKQSNGIRNNQEDYRSNSQTIQLCNRYTNNDSLMIGGIY